MTHDLLPGDYAATGPGIQAGTPRQAASARPDTVARRTLPTTVANRLRELITEGELPAGMRLNERELCDRLGVSRTPLREAFRLLAAQGLVKMQPNRGAQVVALSRTDVRESFEVMAGLEAMAGEAACRHVSDHEIAEIKALTFEMQASHARNDLPVYYRVNREIHDRINLAGHNRLLTQIYSTMNLRIQNLRFRSNLNPDKWEKAMHEHIDMVDALSQRDGPRLAAIMRAHLQRKCETVLEGLPDTDEPALSQAAPTQA